MGDVVAFETTSTLEHLTLNHCYIKKDLEKKLPKKWQSRSKDVPRTIFGDVTIFAQHPQLIELDLNGTSVWLSLIHI